MFLHSQLESYLKDLVFDTDTVDKIPLAGKIYLAALRV
jgi:hypothetical protein